MNERLKQARARKRWTQEAAAENIGIARKTYGYPAKCVEKLYNTFSARHLHAEHHSLASFMSMRALGTLVEPII